jgi:hypothetical protein
MGKTGAIEAKVFDETLEPPRKYRISQFEYSS